MSVICRTHLSGTYRDRTNGKLNNACANPGLAFERYLPSDGEEGHEHQNKEHAKDAQIAFLKGVCASCGRVGVYSDAYTRWELAIKASAEPLPPQDTVDSHTLKCHVATEPIPCSSRVIMGLGNDTGLEVGMTFNRTYGMPVIPGSALKGLCRRYYLKQLEGEENSHWKDDNGKKVSVPNATFHTLFGSTDAGGLITFFDAWYVPGSASDGPLKQDIMTPHHPKAYYGDQGKTPPTDFDDPTPVPFLSASGSFLFAVKGPTEAWTRFAMDLLKLALSDFGVGAKTSSGYGRFRTSASGNSSRPTSEGEHETHRQLPEPKTKSLAQTIRETPEKQVSGSINNYGAKWLKMNDGDEKAEAAQALKAACDKVGWTSGKEKKRRPFADHLEAYLSNPG